VWSSTGDALFGLTRYEEALTAYNRSLELDPNNTDAWALKAFTLKRMGRSNEAAMALKRANELHPANEGFEAYRAWVLGGLERYADILAAYEDAFDAEDVIPRPKTDRPERNGLER
jgi:tetratricopeptide (TPR) repeat protein